MKNFLVAFFLITSLAFAGLYFQQSKRVNDAEAASAGLQQKVVGLEADVARQQQAARSVTDELEHTRSEAIANRAEITHLRDTITNLQPAVKPPVSIGAASTNGKNSNPMADLLKNPQMRSMVRDQQKGILGPMIDKNYAQFIDSMHMTPDQQAAFKDLLMKKTMSGAESSMSLMAGDMDAAKRADVVAQIKTDNDAWDSQIKQFLGDDNFTQFQTYEKTQPDRTAVSSFKDQLASGPTSITPQQEQQLVQMMSQDRQNFKFSTDYNDQSKLNGDLSSYFSPDSINKHLDEFSQLNQVYLTHAGSVLNSDQLAAFQTFLTSQQQLQAAALKMAAKMFAPDK